MRLIIGNKIYNGEQIFSGRKGDIEIDVYCIHPVYDKYLVIHKTANESKDFVVTGMHKVYEVIEILKDKSGKETLEEQVCKALQQIKQQSTIKALKKTDFAKLKELTISFYENNYAIFTILGIKLPDFIRRVEKEAAI